MTEQNEKQAIEEMAKVIETTEQIARDAHCGLPSPTMYAKDLYWKGYRKQSGWISAEKPPEIYRDEYDELIPFLVCCKGTVYPFRAVYDGTNWGDGIGKLKVAYWMPLPEPPKMKGGAE